MLRIVICLFGLGQRGRHIAAEEDEGLVAGGELLEVYLTGRNEGVAQHGHHLIQESQSRPGGIGKRGPLHFEGMRA